MMKLALFACLAAAAIAEPEPWTVYGVYGKREAEAEPEAEDDPQYLTSYRSGYNAPVAYSNYGYGYPSAYRYGLRNYGYSRFGYGKREAEAEPEADAQYLTSYRAGHTAPI